MDKLYPIRKYLQKILLSNTKKGPKTFFLEYQIRQLQPYHNQQQQ